MSWPSVRSSRRTSSACGSPSRPGPGRCNHTMETMSSASRTAPRSSLARWSSPRAPVTADLPYPISNGSKGSASTTPRPCMRHASAGPNHWPWWVAATRRVRRLCSSRTRPRSTSWCAAATSPRTCLAISSTRSNAIPASRCSGAPKCGSWTAARPSKPSSSRTTRPGSSASSPPERSSSSSGPLPIPRGCPARWRWTRTASCSPAPMPTSSAPRTYGVTCRVRRWCWKPADQAFSRPGTSAEARSNGWPRRSAKAPWRSASSTSICSNSLKR